MTKAKITWHKGPPPHVGWWNASYQRKLNTWRFWDGQCWSYAALPGYSPEKVSEIAGIKSSSLLGAVMEWNDSWPKNARVPRTVVA